MVLSCLIDLFIDVEQQRPSRDRGAAVDGGSQKRVPIRHLLQERSDNRLTGELGARTSPSGVHFEQGDLPESKKPANPDPDERLLSPGGVDVERFEKVTGDLRGEHIFVFLTSYRN